MLGLDVQCQLRWCRRPAGGRAERVVDGERVPPLYWWPRRGAAALLAAEPRWSSTMKGAAALLVAEQK